MKGKNSDRALVHLDASIYFYLKWGGKWAIAGCKAICTGLAYHLYVPGIPPTTGIRHDLLFWFSSHTLTIDQTQKLYILQNCLKYLVGPIHSVYAISKNSEEEKCVFLKFYFWKAGPQASDRRTIKGRTVFKIKVVFAAAADQAISNKTSAVEKWLDKIKQWTPIVVQ